MNARVTMSCDCGSHITSSIGQPDRVSLEAARAIALFALRLTLVGRGWAVGGDVVECPTCLAIPTMATVYQALELRP